MFQTLLIFSPNTQSHSDSISFYQPFLNYDKNNKGKNEFLALLNLSENKNLKLFYLKNALPSLISILSSGFTAKRSLLGKVIKQPFTQTVIV